MMSCSVLQRVSLGTGLLLLVSFGALPTPAVGQVLYGSIVGNVTDETRGALPGATVSIVHNESGATRETVTDSMGAYRFTAVQSGTYTVTVKIDGFRTFTRRDVAVTLNSVARVDVPLQVGQLSETVTVSAERPLLQTDRAEVRSELQARELVNLPVSINRNYQYLFRVLPGFTPPAEAHSVPSNPSRALVFNVNGASRSSNNIRIDGVSTTNIWLPHVAAYVPALESLETINVVTSSFDAEQGLAGGSAINAQIKSGTNNFRGSMFEYHTNETLRTQNYFAPAGTPKGDWQYNQYRGHSWRSHHPQQVFLLRQLRGDPRQAEPDANALRTHRGAPSRRSVRSAHSHLRSVHRQSERLGTDPVCWQYHPRRIASIPTARQLLALLPLPNLPTTARRTTTSSRRRSC